MIEASELEQFRTEKDEFYRHDHRSPLTPDQQRDFKGLSYFPENSALVIKARIDRNVQPGAIHMETTKGETQAFRRYGVVRFEVDGQPAQVTLYAPEGSSHELFLPFRDATSGKQATEPVATSIYTFTTMRLWSISTTPTTRTARTTRNGIARYRLRRTG